MRARNRIFPWASSNTQLERYKPVGVTKQKAGYWYNGVAIWNLDVFMQDSGGGILIDVSATVFWNRRNSRSNRDQELQLGWQIDGYIVDVGPSGNMVINLFADVLGEEARSGQGISYGGLDVMAYPFFFMNNAFGFTDDVSASAVVCTIDGETVRWNDLGRGDTGHITMTPDTYWENKRADNTAPVHNAASGALLIPAHQTDELFSNT